MTQNCNDLEIRQNVPGKQLTLNHIIVDPNPQLMSKIDLGDISNQTIGIISIIPGEAIIVAADTAVKYANVTLEQIDRVTGTAIVSGECDEVMNSLNEVKAIMCDCMGFLGRQISIT